MSHETPPSPTERLTRVAEAFGGVRSGVLAMGYFLGLSLLVFYPLLSPGYVLILDMIFSPHMEYVQFMMEVKGPFYYSRLPFLLLLDGLAIGVEDWVIQKTLLVSLVACCGLSAYVASDAESIGARLFAGTVYAINPFVYVRLLAGHWYFLFGYAFLPLSVVTLYRYLSNDDKGRLSHAVGWATVVSVFDPHSALLMVVAGACMTVVLLIWTSDHPTLIRRAGLLSVVYVALNAYWITPVLSKLARGETLLTSFSIADMEVFSAGATVGRSIPVSVSTLHGFWREGYVYSFEVLPRWLVAGLFLVLLFLAVDGWVSWAESRTDQLANTLALVGVVGAFLSMGVSSPVSEPVFRALFEYVPGFSGMRDSQKFVALLALAYSLLGAEGIENLLADTRRWIVDNASKTAVTDRDAASTARRQVMQTARAVLVIALLLVPLLYTVPMLGGFGGQVEPINYPADWYSVNDHLQEDDDEFRVLFLPWHQYMRFSWTAHKIATPAEIFFERPIVQARNLEVGTIETHVTDPTRTQVRALLAQGTDAEYGPVLTELGIKYIVLAKSTDYERYSYMRNQPDLRVVTETEHLVVFENEAYQESPPNDWPTDSPPIPWTELIAGTLISFVTLLALKAVSQGWRNW